MNTRGSLNIQNQHTSKIGAGKTGIVARYKLLVPSRVCLFCNVWVLSWELLPQVQCSGLWIQWCQQSCFRIFCACPSCSWLVAVLQVGLALDTVAIFCLGSEVYLKLLECIYYFIYHIVKFAGCWHLFDLSGVYLCFSWCYSRCLSIVMHWYGLITVLENTCFKIISYCTLFVSDSTFPFDI